MMSPILAILRSRRRISSARTSHFTHTLPLTPLVQPTPAVPYSGQKENECLRQETEAAEATMNEVQQKAIRDSEDMALAMRTRPRSSASAPNLPGLGGGGSSSNVRQAGVDADSRCSSSVEISSILSGCTFSKKTIVGVGGWVRNAEAVLIYETGRLIIIPDHDQSGSIHSALLYFAMKRK